MVIITMLTLTILFGCEKKIDYEKYDVYVEVGIGDRVTIKGTADFVGNNFKPNIYLYDKKQNSIQKQPTKSGSDHIFGLNSPWTKLDDFKLNGLYRVYKFDRMRYNLVNEEEIEVFEAVRIDDYGSFVQRRITYLVLVEYITEIELEYYTNDTIEFG